MKLLWGVCIGCCSGLLLLMSGCSGHSESDVQTVVGSGGQPAGIAGAASAGTGESSAQCVTPADCPAPHSICRMATCIEGVCGTGNVSLGAYPHLDMPPDCQETVCDGNGGLTQVPVDSNAPRSPNECVVSYCKAGFPLTASAAAGAPCTEGGSYCDGNGNCVECIEASECATGQACVGQKCVAGSASTSCSNGIRDQDETDIDCGGSCKSCPNTADCSRSRDCASGACDAWSPHRCLADHCADHRIDFDETDVDCGGSCKPCLATDACKVNADCESKICDHTHADRCVVASCGDGKLDFSETDQDCGDACGACAVGKKCATLADCITHACDAVTLICDADACVDHAQDGTETDVDCGGAGTCARCAVSKKCAADSDCTPGHTCSAPPRTCQ